jgi:hypothetical protein
LDSKNAEIDKLSASLIEIQNSTETTTRALREELSDKTKAYEELQKRYELEVLMAENKIKEIITKSTNEYETALNELRTNMSSMAKTEQEKLRQEMMVELSNAVNKTKDDATIILKDKLAELEDKKNEEITKINELNASRLQFTIDSLTSAAVLEKAAAVTAVKSDYESQINEIRRISSEELKTANSATETVKMELKALEQRYRTKYVVYLYPFVSLNL